MVQAFLLIFIVCMGLYGVVYLGLETILTFLQVPAEVYPLIRQYLLVVFSGLLATFLYNFFACLLRALGNSLTPLPPVWASSCTPCSSARISGLTWQIFVGMSAFFVKLAACLSSPACSSR